VAAKGSPWDVKLSAEKRKDFAIWLCRELDNAKSSRSVPEPEVEYWWRLYEQGRTRSSQSMPWQDAADLTSYLGTEKVDALRARIMRTIFVEPFYTVEGWGASAAKAPFVEDFHQWQLESEGLQSFLARTILASLIEPRGVLEVYEETTCRKARKKIQAQLVMSADGAGYQMDAQTGEPILAKDENDNFIEVSEPGIPSAEVVIDDVEYVRRGPGYRVLPYRDFLVLPSHAKEKSDIFGYAKRFTKRWDLLKEAAEFGTYDKPAVLSLHDNSDVSSERTLAGNPEPVAAQDGPTSEKELYEVQLLHDLGDGLRWYVATVHLPTNTLLRLKHEDQATHRYIIVVLFPRADKSHEGYSLLGHKLITTVEEHTAWRNMLADRASLEISAPIMRVQGALWDPDIQPMGPKAVIDVRDMKEVQAFQIPPAMQGAITREQEIVAASERVAGMTDVVIGGAQTAGDSTLGEFNVRTEQVLVRMDEVIKNLQESLEDLGQARQAIWVNTLKEQQKTGGMLAPKTLFERSAVPGLDDRGGDVAVDGKVTAEMIEGTFRFKPRGSTETADRGRLRADYMQGLQGLALMFQVWPALAQVIGTNPEAAKSAVEQWLRLFGIPDKQAWLGQPKPNPMGGPPIDPFAVIGMPPMMPGMGGGMPNAGMPPPGAPPSVPPNGVEG
jgi:hypothetical protein